MLSLETYFANDLSTAAQLARAWLDDRGCSLSAAQCLELVALVQANLPNSASRPLETSQSLTSVGAEEDTDCQEMVLHVGRFRLVAEPLPSDDAPCALALDVCTVDEGTNWPNEDMLSLPLSVVNAETSRTHLHRLLLAIGQQLSATLPAGQPLSKSNERSLSLLISQWDVQSESFPESATRVFSTDSSS